MLWKSHRFCERRTLAIQQKIILQTVSLHPTKKEKGRSNNVKQMMTPPGFAKQVTTSCSCFCRCLWQPQRCAPQISLQERTWTASSCSHPLCLISDTRANNLTQWGARAWPFLPITGLHQRQCLLQSFPLGWSNCPTCIWAEAVSAESCFILLLSFTGAPSPSNKLHAFLILSQHLLPREPNWHNAPKTNTSGKWLSTPQSRDQLSGN